VVSSLDGDVVETGLESEVNPSRESREEREKVERDERVG
jgi:hypothetical protein